MATFTHDIPAVNVIANGAEHPENVTVVGGETALSTKDTSTEASFEWGGQGGGLITSANEDGSGKAMFPYWTPPPGALITDSRFVCIAYRESGYDHPNPNLSDYFSSATVPTIQCRYNGDGTSFAGKRLDNLPIGAYAGEALSSQGGVSYVIDPGFYGASPPFDPPDGLGISVFAGPGDYGAGFGGVPSAPGWDDGIRLHIAYLAVRITYTLEDSGIDVLMQGSALTRTEDEASALTTMSAPTAEPLTFKVDFDEGVIGEVVDYNIGPTDLGEGRYYWNNRKGLYVEGKDSTTGLGTHLPFGGGQSRQNLGIYGPTSIEGWEIPTTDATTTLDFKIHVLPTGPAAFSLIRSTHILELQHHSIDMDDQRDLGIGINYAFVSDTAPRQMNFYLEGYGDGMTSFYTSTAAVVPDQWYVAKYTISGSDGTISIIDPDGDTVISFTYTFPEGWVQNLWLEAYASTLYDITAAPTQWLEVTVDNLDVTWVEMATAVETVDVLMQGASLALDPDTVTARGVPTLLASSDGEIALTGTVTVNDTSIYPWWGNPHDAVVVGGPEGIWSDGADATYAEVSTAGANDDPTGAGSTGAYNGAWVEMSDLAPEIPVDARVESLTFRVRARHAPDQESPYNQGIYVQLYNATDFNVVAMAGGGNYEESDPPSANYPASWKFPDDHSWATQEYTVQAYNIAGATEGGWEAQGWDSQEQMDAWVDGRKKKLADTLRAGPVQVVVRGGAPPGDLPGFDAQDTQYDVAEVSLSYVLSSASDEIDLLMQSASLTRSTA
jgi:hypothetical protein